ncbi:hypothetical protein N7492_006511 [Penicillium capsulatum]|uniref:tRNA (guanine(9)-N1)-methyltransferase n=1 Tax=Penicillium capsulatum TaxID=69766 RepID=A0A9W9LKS2_9EURO|nr:hypothetical protein N7492_006511 [Penicillium capsulatum]KAJ6116347.1 hypothetical protein N7512_006072 [Penicillium capsulatum]
MDEEERPKKVAKIDTADDNVHEELGPVMTGAVDSSSKEHADVPVADNAHPPPSDPLNAVETVHGTEDFKATEDTTPKISKKQLKKQKRREKWDEQRDQRKEKRKQKLEEKRERRSLMVQEAREKGGEEAVKALRRTWEPTKSKHRRSTLLPLAMVMDCSYDELMAEKERTSLSSQLTRTYSSNSGAKWRSHVIFSSFDKLLKERFDTVLPQYKNWKGIDLIPEDFAYAAELAKERMLPGKFAGPFAEMGDTKPEDGEVIYLSSDSPNTLTELKPYSTYIVGGLVDKNRHKGVCYKKAVEKGIKTAKLPIGDFIQMESRSVLTTNHVVEIMLQWLELGDWGEAFMKVLPSRKGGKLREQGKATATDMQEEEEDDDDEKVEVADDMEDGILQDDAQEGDDS